MKLPISKRLMACAAWVDPGQRVADIGTDHGYLAIYLLRSGRARRVLAADIAPQPLERARENARRFGVQAGLSFHQCDGVRGLPRDFDVLLMAGLGAETMIQILQGGPWLRTGGYRLILQCQSSQNELRQYLSENGWQISREAPVRDGKFLYTVLEAKPGRQALTPGQHFVSLALLEEKNELVGEYLAFCRRTVEQVVSGLTGRPGPKYEYYSTALSELMAMEVGEI